jgi:hypothetical protein
MSTRFSDLSSSQQRAFWAEIEGTIRVLLDELPESFPAADRETVSGYLDHNELGLALEHLCDSAIEVGLVISDQHYAVVSRLFERMELDPSGRLRCLASRRLTSGCS